MAPTPPRQSDDVPLRAAASTTRRKANYEYKSAYRKIAYRLAMLGWPDKKIAKEMNCSTKTFSNWKRDEPEFARALKRGRDHINSRVASAIAKRALGYQFPVEETDVTEQVVHLIPTNGPDAGTVVTRTNRTTRLKTTTKVVLPDVVAGIFWLKNREREHWYDAAPTPPAPPQDAADRAKEVRDAIRAIRAQEGLDAEPTPADGEVVAPDNDDEDDDE